MQPSLQVWFYIFVSWQWQSTVAAPGTLSLVPSHLYDASRDLDRIEAYVNNHAGGNLQTYDMFAGSSNFYFECLKENMQTRRFEILVDKRQDIWTRHGFDDALDSACCLIPGATALVGCPCSWWIFMSSSLHKRKKLDPVGDTTCDGVIQSNLLIVNVTVLMCILLYKGVPGLQLFNTMFMSCTCFATSMSGFDSFSPIIYTTVETM